VAGATQEIMSNTIALDEVNRTWLGFTSRHDYRWLRRHVDQIVAGVPDALTSSARVVLEEVAASYARALELGAEPSAESCARVRAAGAFWAATGVPLDSMVTEFGELTNGTADLLICRRRAVASQVRDLMNAANRLMREFLAGASRWRTSGRSERRARGAGGDLVAQLIAGELTEAESQLAKSYLIVAVNWPRPESAPRVGRIIRECGGAGTLLGAGEQLVALIPDREPGPTGRVMEELERRLAGQAWAGVAFRDRAGLPDGHREATDILRLVVAGGRAPGVYRLADCFIEYAVTRNKPVAEILVSVVSPLMEQPVLWETMEALIRADFNRNEAAKQIFVHRSTLDYRLHRIEEVTGYDPMSNRGAQVLSAAMTTQALARLAFVPPQGRGVVA